MKKPICASSFSTTPLTFSSSLIFFGNKSARDFGPSGEPRMISSSYFGVLIPEESFRKDAKIVDCRFSGFGQKDRFTNFEFELVE